ncbi:MAG: bifunctional DNA primase/polymerase [Salinibacter sp.]
MAETTNAKANAALAYAEQDLRVLPLHWIVKGSCTCGNSDCSTPGKHPYGPLLGKGGAHCATTDPEEIQAWWEQVPDANVGIATGEHSGVAVLDVDPEHGGDEALQRLQDDHEPLPETLRTLSGGGGQHLWFAYPADGVRSGQLDGKAVQLQSNGLLIVAPPSDHKSGTPYRFDATDWRSHFPLPALPQWIVDILGQKPDLQDTTSPASSGRGESFNLDPGSITRNPLPQSIPNLHPKAVQMIHSGKVPDHYPSPSERDFYVAKELHHAGMVPAEIKYVFANYPIGETLGQRHAKVPDYLDWTIHKAHPLTLIAKYHLHSLRTVLAEMRQSDRTLRRRKWIPISNEELKSKLREHHPLDEKTFRTLLDFLDRTKVRKAKRGKTSTYHVEQLQTIFDKLQSRTPTQILDEFTGNL